MRIYMMKIVILYIFFNVYVITRNIISVGKDSHRRNKHVQDFHIGGSAGARIMYARTQKSIKKAFMGEKPFEIGL